MLTDADEHAGKSHRHLCPIAHSAASRLPESNVGVSFSAGLRQDDVGGHPEIIAAAPHFDE